MVKKESIRSQGRGKCINRRLAHHTKVMIPSIDYALSHRIRNDSLAIGTVSQSSKVVNHNNGCSRLHAPADLCPFLRSLSRQPSMLSRHRTCTAPPQHWLAPHLSSTPMGRPSCVVIKPLWLPPSMSQELGGSERGQSRYFQAGA